MQRLSSRHRAWIFTDYAEEQPTSVPFEYLVVQRERCPTTGRLHWQGYCVFSNPRTLGGVKKVLPKAHWEPRRGSHEDARDYCTKAETRVSGPFEYGSPPAQGTRSDLGELCDAVARGASDRELAGCYPVQFLKFGTHISRLRMALMAPRHAKTVVAILWGPTGCGKSRWAHDTFEEAFTKDPSQWWDGYCGQRVTILDEFYGQLPHEFMLKLMDRYPLSVQIKGGYAVFNSELVIITSNRDPREWYSGLTERGIDWKPQFFRRIEYEFKYAGGTWWKACMEAGIDDPIWEESSLPVSGQLLTVRGLDSPSSS